MRARRTLLVALLMLPACGVTTGTPATDAVPTTRAAPASPATTAGENPCRDPGFVEGPSVGTVGAGVGDAARIEAIRWEGLEGCERVVVELATADGAPATTAPELEAILEAELGVLRLVLDPAIRSTAVADTLLDGALASRAFVVRAADGSLFVDLHLGRQVAARLSAARSPARAIIDLIDRGEREVPGPVSVAQTVVLEPAGPEVSYPITVRGYSRAFEANVVVRVRKANRIVFERAVQAADWVETWGSFELTIAEGPNGRMALVVGGESPAGPPDPAVEISLVAG